MNILKLQNMKHTYKCLLFCHLVQFQYTVKLGYIKLGFYEYMVYIEVLSRPERNPIDFHVK